MMIIIIYALFGGNWLPRQCYYVGGEIAGRDGEIFGRVDGTRFIA